MDVPLTGDIEAYLARHEQKELLRFVTVGSVDDGKSTLIGRLLHDTHGIYEDQLRAVQKASKKHGTTGGAIDLALLTDGLKAEREQGITIDVAYRYFSTEKRKFIIADTPGHVQYTRNMATGASTANVAIILIDARHGVLQQSRRHAYIASLLGIPHLVVCVNKMDLVTVSSDSHPDGREFDEGVFRAVEKELSEYCKNLRFREVRFFPISAVAGDNVAHASDRAAWYAGGTLLSYLETVPIDDDRGTTAFRFPVQYVLRPNLDYRGFAGQIASGVVRPGDEVVVLPSGKRTRVTGIDAYQGELREAFAPMSTTLRLADEIDISRGDMLAHPGSEPTATRRFEAHLVWMSERPLDRGKSYFLKHTARMVRASVESIAGRIDLESLGQVEARELGLNDIARVTIAANQPLFVDPYAENRSTGAFILVDALTNDTVAAGMIARALEDRGHGPARRERSAVGRGERETLLGQKAALVWFTGEPAAGQAELAFELERRLVAAGRLATVVDVEQLFDATRSPLLFADIAEQCLRAGAIVLFAGALRRAADREQVRARVPEDQRVELGARVGADEALAAVLARVAR
jgi:bifunctional enzyme CysN/CysC